MEAAASCCTAWGLATGPSSDACLRLHRQLTACPHKLPSWTPAVGLLWGLKRCIPPSCPHTSGTCSSISTRLPWCEWKWPPQSFDCWV